MIFRILSLLLFLICFFGSTAQESRLDSLMAKVKTSPEEEKINLYFDIADEYYYNSYHKYIEYSRKAKELALKYELPKKILSANNSIAIGYNQMGVYDSALIYYQKVLDYVLADMDSIKIAITIRNIGIVHHSQ
ncbi:MAG: hypothetical protein DRJ05_15825, partial [Bacteroidetes bacterium]